MTSLSSRASGATRSRLIIRILVTAATGGVTYLLSYAVRQPPAQSLMLSAFVGGVALVVQVLATVETGQDQLATEMRGLVTQTFAGVSDATRLFGQVDASALRDDVVRLAHTSLRVGHSVPPLLLELARSQLERTTHLLHEVAGGSEVTYDGEDRDWLLALTHHVTSTLDATSSGSVNARGEFVDEGLWRTELGQRYLEAQGRALRHGVAIRRVFILEKAESLDDPTFREICDEQRNMGIQVHAVVLREVRGAGIPFVSDFILFDDVVSYESKLTVSKVRGGQPMFVGTTLVLDQRLVSQQRQRFDELWAAPNQLRDSA
ncbi:MAG TPA: hypothetical protein VJT31_39695 [Rugosimonospora sp.]|nr:hypothetical protein [Rugosimonospora sp.]